jgi:CubicO group peptidase (beta-lactamase class C family)
VLAQHLQHFVTQNVMAGAVMLVADKDQILDLETVGYADLATRRPMRDDDIFWIASMTKSVTAAAVMMLVDDGKVKLDDPVAKYISAFKNVRIALPGNPLAIPTRPIQIRDLLSHTSGMGFLNTTDAQLIDSVPLEESVRHDLLEPLQFEPGSIYKYSNEGMDTAGRIIEIESGIPYERFLRDRLFKPLGMRDTTFSPTPIQLQRLAHAYKNNPSKSGLEETPIRYLRYPLGGPDHFPAPGGGLFSTARDVARFCQMLANDGKYDGKTYLSPNAVRQMTSRQTGPHIKESYGFGLSVRDGYFGHGGAYKTDMCVDHGQIRVFLVQQANDWANGNPAAEFSIQAKKFFPVANASPN